MASRGDGGQPADDTVIAGPDEQPTHSDETWPVSDLYLVKPADDDPAEKSAALPDAAPTAVVTEPSAVGRPPRRFPPDVRPGLMLAIAGSIATAILVAFLLGLRPDDAAKARTAATSSTTTTSEQPAATPAPAGAPQISLRDVTGMPLAKARSLLEKQGLHVEVSRVQSDRLEGEVLTQEPAAGKKVPQGHVVLLVVSGGESIQPTSTDVRVPGVVGLSASEAFRTIREAGLEARVRMARSSQPVGTVVNQWPAEYTGVARGTMVRLDVAKAAPGPVRVDVPDVVGSTVAAARLSLRSAGLIVRVVDVELDETAGTVVSQSPGAGSRVREGSEVTLRVSSGAPVVDVPDVTGLDESSATAQLESEGFQVRLIDEPTSDASEDRLVIRQSPQGGSTAAKGAVITLTVARLA